MNDNAEKKTMLKEAGILFAITLIAGLLLGGVHELTKEPIAKQQQKAVMEACSAVFPGNNNLTFTEIPYAVPADVQDSLAEQGVTIGTVFEATDASGLIGYVVESASSKGYGGTIDLYVGISTKGIVEGVSILEISETPGLGMEAPNVLTPQFAGKKAETFVYTKTGATADNEVDAISSATITTKAVTNAVNGAVVVASDLCEGGAANE